MGTTVFIYVWSNPCTSRVSELLKAPDYLGYGLVLYWLGTNWRILVQGIGNNCPTTEVPSPVYVLAVRIHQQPMVDVPEVDLLDTLASRLCESLCAAQVQSRTINYPCDLSLDLPRPWCTSIKGLIEVSWQPGIASRRSTCALTVTPQSVFHSALAGIF